MKRNLTQLSLLGDPPSRRTDPDTSREAARKHRRSADAHRSRVLAALVSHPGSTYRELAAVTGIECHEVMKRLNGLENEGLAWKGLRFRKRLPDQNAMAMWYSSCEAAKQLTLVNVPGANLVARTR